MSVCTISKNLFQAIQTIIEMCNRINNNHCEEKITNGYYIGVFELFKLLIDQTFTDIKMRLIVDDEQLDVTVDNYKQILEPPEGCATHDLDLLNSEVSIEKYKQLNNLQVAYIYCSGIDKDFGKYHLVMSVGVFGGYDTTITFDSRPDLTVTKVLDSDILHGSGEPIEFEIETVVPIIKKNVAGKVNTLATRRPRTDEYLESPRKKPRYVTDKSFLVSEVVVNKVCRISRVIKKVCDYREELKKFLRLYP